MFSLELVTGANSKKSKSLVNLATINRSWQSLRCTYSTRSPKNHLSYVLCFVSRSSAYQIMQSYVDLPVLVNSIPSITKAFTFPATESESNSSPHLSLNRLSQLILNTAMDKTLQLTNWEKRPLEYACACYAALDVGALVKIVEVILERLSKCLLSSWE